MLLVLAVPLLLCCGPPVPGSPPAAEAAEGVSFEPSAASSAVSGVVHLHIARENLGVGEISLFQGSLSSYYLARVKSGELPETLAARQIPVVSWRANTEWVLAPIRPLPPGEYSLTAGTGLLTQFQVAASQPLLTRLWPPASSAGGLAHVVYCGDGSAPLTLDPLQFEPGELSIMPSPGVAESGPFADRCLHFDSEVELGPAQIVVPPPVSGAWALDPAPFSGAAAQTAPSLVCRQDEQALGPGCAAVADDRLTIRTPDAALLWALSTAHGSALDVTQSSTAFVLRGLTPGSREHVWGRVYDATGAKQDFDLFADMATARERPVLNEVLANPLGPEPQSEWLELVNDGTLALDLSHFSLRDGGGSMLLPEATLAAGEYALLVREDFAPSADDVPPAPGALLIRIPQLGRSGLSNSGERLALIDGNSLAVSALPALAAKAGESLSRRHPWSLDDDPADFTTGTPTPGAPNE